MDNIMFGIDDDAVFEDFEKQELENPCPRKEVDGRLIYLSRELDVPRNLGPPVLCDFGAAVSGVNENVTDVQPDLYRAPEIILEIPWKYEIDIWNAGCMVRFPFGLTTVLVNRLLIHPAFRSGICLRADTCSPARIRSTGNTAAEPTSPASSHSSEHRRGSSLSAAP